MFRVIAARDPHRVIDYRLYRREPVAHSTRGSRQIDDERARAHAGQSARQRGARKARQRQHPYSLGDSLRLALDRDARRLGGHVARREPGAAGGEHHIGGVAIAPGNELAHDRRGIVRDERPRRKLGAARRAPGGDRVAGGVVAETARASVAYGENCDSHPGKYAGNAYTLPTRRCLTRSDAPRFPESALIAEPVSAARGLHHLDRTPVARELLARREIHLEIRARRPVATEYHARRSIDDLEVRADDGVAHRTAQPRRRLLEVHAVLERQVRHVLAGVRGTVVVHVFENSHAPVRHVEAHYYVVLTRDRESLRVLQRHADGARTRVHLELREVHPRVRERREDADDRAHDEQLDRAEATAGS